MKPRRRLQAGQSTAEISKRRQLIKAEADAVAIWAYRELLHNNGGDFPFSQTSPWSACGLKPWPKQKLKRTTRKKPFVGGVTETLIRISDLKKAYNRAARRVEEVIRRGVPNGATNGNLAVA